MMILGDIIKKTRIEIFNNSIPQENYDTVYLNENLESDWYLKHSIPKTLFYNIINEYVFKYNLKDPEKQIFINSIILGPCPVILDKNSSMSKQKPC